MGLPLGRIAVTIGSLLASIIPWSKLIKKAKEAKNI